MKGMYDDEEEDENGRLATAVRTGDDGSFLSASLGRRAAIVIAGPLFNFLLAFVAAVVIIASVGYDPALVLEVREDSAAYEAGLRPNDTITSFMGHRVMISRDISAELTFHELPETEPLTMTVKRDGQKIDIAYVPDPVTAYRFGITYQPGAGQAVLLSVSEGSPFDKAGLKENDIITALNGTEVASADEMSAYLTEHPLDGSPVTVTYERDGQSHEITAAPVEVTYRDMGFDYNVGREKTGPVGVLSYSLYEVEYWIKTTVRSLGLFFTGGATVKDLSGPVGIVDIVGETYEESKPEGAFITWLSLLNIMLFLSANLGVMNLLPIPAVDGGRLLFIIIEAIRGKPMDTRIENAVQMVAVALLLALMVFVMYNDISRLIH